MNKIIVESIQYNSVLCTEHLYTKRLIENIIERFHKDEEYREGMLCVLKDRQNREHLYLDYTMLVGKIINLWLDESKQKLITELLILDTPVGRMVEQSIREGALLHVIPVGMADDLTIDGISILSQDKYSLFYFEVEVLPQ